MQKRSKLQAEDLLAKENFTEDLIYQCAEDGSIDNNEIRIIKNIYSFLDSSGENLTCLEKEHTKNKIKSSVRKLSLKRQLIRTSVAASLLLAVIVTSVVYFRTNSQREIVSFAQSISTIKAGNSTRLILQHGEEVVIDKEQSQIRYDSKGENILIDSNQKVAQNLKNAKAVFNTVIVPFGKRTQIIFSEGTKVWLNSGSKLVYPAVFSDSKREVYIEGEALFDVIHINDKPFIVSTKDFEIKDLGTVFNVSVYSDDKYSSAILDKGKIELIYHGTSILTRKKLDMSPGTMAVFDRDQKSFKQKQVNTQKYLSWREGYLIFNSERLQNILIKLSRYYNIEMVITDNQLKNETFSGLLDLKNSPEEVLAVINETTPLSFSINNDKIFINPKIKMPMEDQNL